MNSQDFPIIAAVWWIACAVAAAVVGPRMHATKLFVLTFLFLGPIGVGVAMNLAAKGGPTPAAP
jgi:hypothetical protein